MKVFATLAAAAVLVAGLFVANPANADSRVKWTAAKAEKVWRGKGKAPVHNRAIRKYRLKNWELKRIKRAKRWARGYKPRAVRRCESGNNYRINTGNGYYGAYQFAYGTWRGVGGQRFASTANRAPRWAQDYMAWKLWKQAGWQPWGCA